MFKYGFSLLKSMDLKEILASDRIKTAKKSLEIAFPSYFSDREKTLKKVDLEKMKKDLKEIKKNSLANLGTLKEKAIKNLENQNIRVFEAKDAKEACEIALKLIPENEKIAKSKSNVIEEIGLLDLLKKKDEIIETDCGDFIVNLCEEASTHPVTPALHIPLKKIVERIEEKFGVKINEDPDKIVSFVGKQIKKDILESKIGLTGANVISADGAVLILENEGNISLVSRIPEKHIIITGIDKIVSNLQEAITVCQASTIWGTGANLPTYINIISSPSKTADIQKKTIFGVQGAKEICLILVDNGRSEIIKQGFGELLHCINCGSCLYFCPVYRQIFDNYGFHYFAGKGIGMTLFQEGVKQAFDHGLYFCSTCLACKQNCPLDIDIPELIRKFRKKSVEEGIETSANRKMIENVEAVGNPFGEEIEKGKMPKELYCC